MIHHATTAGASSGLVALITWLTRFFELTIPAEVIGAIAVLIGYLVAELRRRTDN